MALFNYPLLLSMLRYSFARHDDYRYYKNWSSASDLHNARTISLNPFTNYDLVSKETELWVA